MYNAQMDIANNKELSDSLSSYLTDISDIVDRIGSRNAFREFEDAEDALKNIDRDTNRGKFKTSD